MREGVEGAEGGRGDWPARDGGSERQTQRYLAQKCEASLPLRIQFT